MSVAGTVSEIGVNVASELVSSSLSIVVALAVVSSSSETVKDVPLPMPSSSPIALRRSNASVTALGVAFVHVNCGEVIVAVPVFVPIRPSRLSYSLCR